MSVLRLFRDLSIHKKLLLSNIAIIFIPMIILGWYAYDSTKNSLEKQAIENMSHSLNQTAAEISYRLDRQEKTINSVVFNPTLVEGIGDDTLDFVQLSRIMNEKIEPILTTNLYYGGDIKEMYIYVEGRELAYGNFILPSSRIAQYDWYQETKRHRGTSWWYNDNKLFATHNIYNTYNGEIIGIFYLQLDYEETVLQVLKKMPAGHLVIITDGQRPLFASEKPAQLSSLLSANSSDSKVTINGEQYFSLEKPIDSSTWSMEYYVPASNINIEASKILSAATMVVLLSMLVLSLLLYVLSQTFLKSIYKLNNKMKLVENGDMSVSVRMESRDEIGQLSARFDKMLHKVNQLISEVYQAQISQREAELVALQAQISPHFLYNTLSHINSKALLLESDSISEMVTELASFYRTALNQGQNIISVREELLNIKTYISIQSKMHNGSFTVIFKVEEEIMQYDMINLILQPIVENAIEHGIDCKEDGGGSLLVEGKRDGKDILFIIEDNGPGFVQASLEEVMSSHKQGYGLRNVQERLQLFFGLSYGLSLLGNGEYGRTRIQIRIPIYERASS